MSMSTTAATSSSATMENKQNQNKQLYAWCCTAEFLNGNSNYDKMQIHRIAGYENSIDGVGDDDDAKTDTDMASSARGLGLDLTKSADWMEFVEGPELAGKSAYDTLRCDLVLHKQIKNADHDKDNHNIYHHSPSSPWKIWGLEYHLNRLQYSFETLQTTMGRTNKDFSLHDHDKASNAAAAVNQAVQQSRILFDALLLEAAKSEILNRFRPLNEMLKVRDEDGHESEKKHVIDDNGAMWIQLIRFTWLWTLEEETKDIVRRGHSNNKDDEFTKATIRVRAHACSSAQPVNVFQPKTSIVCSLAATTSVVGGLQLDEKLPHRYNHHPQVKLTEWTRQRKQLEQAHARYQTASPNGSKSGRDVDAHEPIGEVLLVHQIVNDDNDAGNNNRRDDEKSIELLEGLSSNVFVFTKDGRLHTAASNVVLPGYVRHLILQIYGGSGSSATTDDDDDNNDKVQPILLENVDQWQEVFITSSSRLILPVRKIVIPICSSPGSDDDDDGEDRNNQAVNKWIDFWTWSPSDKEGSIPKWRQLEHQLLQLGGYR